ncbi:response regulator transcription factor [Alkalilimnicola ehrlichii MLHE-1]|uniref:Response regulator receiver protein n=1 Tax=Alkalilimnicola ehrlichii (strain ATCC BAA-1101 / DSM 17681 / MLHE-1) TaxID=187272 RepID=Q0A850_ALKEH|nr:response regulator transcription factor [Alkalilimnicola ehrlichii]ABI56987.1 response regulator receiver protein [Alkalilimnicola ehrlichii MLHE-1]
MTEKTSGTRVLLVDDDEVFCSVLGRGLTRRGYRVEKAHDAEQALVVARDYQPEHVVLDLKLGDDSGLKLIQPLLEAVPEARIIVLTGYASIPTAVEAVKLGAANYLPKPVDVDTVVSAFSGQHEEPVPTAEPPPQPMSLKRLEWEQIQRVLAEHDGNISAAARALGIHRRTLQRKLGKRPVKR